MLVIVPLHGAVGGFIFIVAVRRDQNGGHHGKGAESRSHHVAHNVAVIVLEGPDKAAFGTDHAGDRVIDQGIEISNTGFVKGFFIFFVIEPLEDALEVLVVGLGDGILAGEPQVFLPVQGELEAGPCKALDRMIRIMDALQDAGTVKFMDGLADDRTVIGGKDQFSLARSGNPDLGIFVDVTVSVTGHCDGLLPGTYIGIDAFYKDGGPEDRAVQNGADGTVGALIHTLEVILFDSGLIGSNSGALDGNAVFLCRFGSVKGNLVICLIPVGKAQIIILGPEIDIRQQELILDQLPDDPCHLISVHLHKGRLHLDFAHVISPLYLIFRVIRGSQIRDAHDGVPWSSIIIFRTGHTGRC